MDAYNMAMESHLFPEGGPAPTKEQFIQTVGPTLRKWYSTDVTDMEQLFSEEYETCVKRGFHSYMDLMLHCLGFKKDSADRSAVICDLRTKALVGTNIRRAEDLDTFLVANPWAFVLFPALEGYKSAAAYRDSKAVEASRAFRAEPFKPLATAPVAPVVAPPAPVARPALVPQTYEEDYEDYDDEDPRHGHYGAMDRCLCGCGETSCGVCIDVCRCWDRWLD